MATTKKASSSASVRRTDANPEVKSADTLEPTQAQVRKDLEGHSAFERETGVKPEELDKRPVVDADPGDGKTFDERTSARAPWDTYQEKRSKAIATELQDRTGDSEKLTRDSVKKDK